MDGRLGERIRQQTDKHTYGQTNKFNNKQTNKQTNGQTNQQTHKQTHKRTDRQTDGTTNKQTKRIKTNRPTQKQTKTNNDKPTVKQTKQKTNNRQNQRGGAFPRVDGRLGKRRNGTRRIDSPVVCSTHCPQSTVTPTTAGETHKTQLLQTTGLPRRRGSHEQKWLTIIVCSVMFRRPRSCPRFSANMLKM